MERDPNASFTLPPEALAALKRGSLIEAVKIVRDSTGVGLAEAKSIVEAIHKQLPKGGFQAAHTGARSPTQRLGPGQVGTESAGIGKWIALIAVAVVAIGAAIWFTA